MRRPTGGERAARFVASNALPPGRAHGGAERCGRQLRVQGVLSDTALARRQLARWARLVCTFNAPLRCTTVEQRRSDCRPEQPTHRTRSSEKQPARGHHKRPGRRAKRTTRPRCRTTFRRCWCRHGPADGDCGAGQRVCAGSGACFGPPRAFPVAGDDGEGPQPSAHRQNAHPMLSSCSLIGLTQRRTSTSSAVTVMRAGEGPENPPDK